MLLRFWVLAATSVASSVAVSSPPAAAPLRRRRVVDAPKSRLQLHPGISQQYPNLRSVSTRSRPPLHRVSSGPRSTLSVRRMNYRRSDPPEQRQASRSASPKHPPTLRSAPQKLLTAKDSVPSKPHRAGSPKRALKLSSNTESNQNEKKKPIGPTAAARVVPPPLPDETALVGRSKPDASMSESPSNLQFLDGLSQIGLPIDAASFLSAAEPDAASLPGPPTARSDPSSAPPVEELPPTDEYYNASLLGRERLGPALAAELLRHASARRRAPPPPPGLPHPLPPPPELRPRTPPPSRRMHWVIDNNEEEEASLWLMHDLMKQAIYQAQERAKALQDVINKYMRSLFFRMGFVFRKLEEQEKELHMMFTHMRRTWYHSIRWPWYYHIDYYNICLQRNVDISYMVDRIIEVFNKFNKAREEHVMSVVNEGRGKKTG